MTNLRLVDPTRELAAEFRAMAAEWRDAGENKFKDAFGDFSTYVASLEAASKARDLPPNRVPSNTYWLVTDENRVVGTSRLRHWLVPHLEKEGGHIGYDIRPSERRKGYGTVILTLTLDKAQSLGLREVIVTCDSDNVGSARIIEKNGGQAIGTVVSDHTGKQVSRYRIRLSGIAMDDTRILGKIAVEFMPEENVTIGNWFGKPCLKVGGKVFAALWRGDMAFKLTKEAHREALEIEGAHLFDPRGKGQPMKEWVQIPRSQSCVWSRFAKLSSEYVAGAAEVKKGEIISGLVEVRRRILDEASILSPVEQDKVFLGIWTIKNMLAHLVGWDYTNLKAVKAILVGQRPSFWEYHDRDWETYNARLVAKYGQDDLAELIASVRESHRKLIDFLQTIPADEYIRKKKIVTLLRAEIKDENVHYGQVKEFREHQAAQVMVASSKTN